MNTALLLSVEKVGKTISEIIVAERFEKGKKKFEGYIFDNYSKNNESMKTTSKRLMRGSTRKFK